MKEPEDYCYVTGKMICPIDEPARFSYKFNAWVSVEGQKIIKDAVSSEVTASMMTPSQKEKYKEYWMIHQEWTSADDEDDLTFDEFIERHQDW